MFQPSMIEELAEYRRRELIREAQLIHLLASIRPPRRGWRERLGRGMQIVGARLADWGDRLEAAQATCRQVQPNAMAVRAITHR